MECRGTYSSVAGFNMGMPTVMQFDLDSSHYRDLRRKKVKLTFWEALSFSIASTWATRPKPPPDEERSARQFQAIGYGLVYYFTHKFRG